jgi:hypothetical protein
MTDPQILYTVTAIVVAALVVWVAFVLAKAPNAGDARKRHGGGPPTPPAAPSTEPIAEPKADESA